MSEKENINYDLNKFETLQIGLASPEKILDWSHGEVTKPETINYRTLKPEPDGLFCERIFGPTKDWECYCRKYKQIKYRGIVCDVCGVEVTKAKVRRERLGHIKLATPVSHIWYFKGQFSWMGKVLDMKPKDLEHVLYFDNYIVLDPGETGLNKKDLLDELEYRKIKEEYKGSFEAEMGAAAIKKLLKEIDLDEESAKLKEALAKYTDNKKERKSDAKVSELLKRLKVIEALRKSDNKPEWMILDVIPVIPPDLRPMVQLDGGRFATSDLNDLYRRVINRNNRLKRLMEIASPDIIIRNEKRMLQEAVDALIENGGRGRAVTGPGQRPLKSLSDILKGKQGRFRQNLLGKRVDFSGRSVIVVGPELRFYQCGLPKEMALELFKPFIQKKLIEKGMANQNIKNAKKLVEKGADEVWEVIEEVIKDHPVMLNRAPTLHRLGIQAFEPVLVEGKAIKLHPLVCTAFNADFDGDQMAVHVPLSAEAQAEARFLMLSVNNILAPKNGEPITTPTQDMILGAYYLTYPGNYQKKDGDKVIDKLIEFNELDKKENEGFERVPEKGDGKMFSDMDEMLMAYQTGAVSIHAKVKVRMYNGEDDQRGKLVESTVGRFIFNQGIPQDIGIVDRSADPYSLEVDFTCKKKKIEEIIDKCFRAHGNTRTVLMLDYIKDIGFHYSTKAAITIGISDMEIPAEKETIIAEADKVVEQYEDSYRMGFTTREECDDSIKQVWEQATNEVRDVLMESLGSLNNLKIMADSGARGSKDQIKQIGGMRGLMAKANGQTVKIPIKKNFREGLSVLDYFVSTNGARKGLADTALRTADSGYLTRRLVDVSHNVIVNEMDCGTEDVVEIKAFVKKASGGEKGGKSQYLETLKQRIVGRVAGRDILVPDGTGEIIVARNEEITEDIADRIEKEGIETVPIRSIMRCRSRHGVCAMCYGRNLATGEMVNIGEAVGITAAQSIGEPGTQLTMRTFHTGGVAGKDITNGLPRVVELFEARVPKGVAVICEEDGEVVNIERGEGQGQVTVRNEDGDRTYAIPYNATLEVKEGDKIEAGSGITEGPLYPKDIFRLKGVDGVYDYMIREVQEVYVGQGVGINDKHIEVIVKQMLSNFKVRNAGDTDLLPGEIYSEYAILDENARVESEGGEPAEYARNLLGIKDAALASDSFLSAASFQETTKILRDAAIKGKKDHLVGLKENVIIGKLIPAGTGMKRYKDIDIDYGENQEIIDNSRKALELAKLEGQKEPVPEVETPEPVEPVEAAAE